MSILKSEIMKASNDSAKPWILWTNVFVMTDNIIYAVYKTEEKKGDETVLKALKGIHIALKNVDNNFVKVADALIKGEKIPEINLPPVELADWDEKSGISDGIIDSICNAVSLIMEIIPVESESTCIEMVLKSLEGLINACKEFKDIMGKKNTIPEIAL